jgi:UDP-N-acetylmuramoyl-tripeptide--D-alanyl-D-alanine ligase
MNINPLRFFHFHLLLLQLEEYDLNRFFISIINTKGIPPDRPFRKPLKLTLKILMITFMSVVLMTIHIPFTLLFFPNILLIIPIIIVELYFGFIFISLGSSLLLPFDLLIKQLIIFLAKNKIRSLKKLKIIGISGSYGKTGMKDIVSTILAEKYQIVKTPESVNTPLGISQVILKNLNRETDFFVVEMGEYYPRDIENICRIARPDIGIITGVNEAHFERLKSIDAAVETIFELARFMKSNGILFLNEKDNYVKNSYKKFLRNQTVYLYKNREKTTFNENLPGYVYKNIPLKILGEFNFDKIDAAVFLSKKLFLTGKEIEAGLKKIKTPDHRLQPFLNLQNNLLIIDDSYNGNPNGVEEAVKTLALFKNRRKIFITPGLVETGEKTREIHKRIGKILNDVVDLTILVKNSVTPYIAEGLSKSGFEKEKILWFPSMFEVQKKLSSLVKPGDVVLFQNDWPDNYV